MRFHSIRFKTNLLYSGILLIIFVIYNFAIFFTVKANLVKEFDGQLKVKADAIYNFLQAYNQNRRPSSFPFDQLSSFFREDVFLNNKARIDQLWRSQFEALGLKNDYIVVRTMDGQVLMRSLEQADMPQEVMERHFGFSPAETFFKDITSYGHRFRIANIPYYGQPSPLVVQIASSSDHIYHFLDKLLAAGLLFMAVALLFTSFLGNIFVKRVLAPVMMITDMANNITHRDLAVRIPDKHTDAEIRHLIGSLNAMIERLQMSFSHVSEFNSHVAHELKTPLAIIKGEMELMAGSGKIDEDTARMLSDSMSEIDRMIKITQDLLLLAKIDYRPQVLKFVPLDIALFLKEIYEHSVILAAEKNIGIKLDCPLTGLTVCVDKVHLRRLFLNVVANALRHSPPGAAIEIVCRREGASARVDIVDHGAGIPPSDIDKVFNKFFRGDSSGEEGVGLGLSIALSIARAHQGDIAVANTPGSGATFSIFLPLAA